MEIKITTSQILKFLCVLSWIIFVGVCIEAGGFIFNTLFTLFINPVGAHKFWQQVDLSSLYDYDKGYFVVITMIMCIVAIMKAWMFYLIIKVFYNKNLSLARPFNTEIRTFILCVAYFALGIGFFSNMGANYSEWLIKQGVNMPDIEFMRLGGADVWFFMGITLIVIAQIFKRGIELQAENELTI